MKKTKRFLSCMLACLMLFSTLPVFATTATTSASASEAFFCDFEEGFSVGLESTQSQDNEFLAAGFKSLGWGSAGSNNSTTTYGAKVVNDTVLGSKAYKSPASTKLALGIGFDAPVTTGAVKLAFTVKADANEGFPYIMYAKEMGSNYMTEISGARNFMGQILPDSAEKGYVPYTFLSAGGSSLGAGVASGTESMGLTTGSPMDFEWIIDIDNDKKYLYINGSKIAECTDNAIEKIQGFYLRREGGAYASPAVDNILLTTYNMTSETMNLVKTIKGDGKVKFVFDEVIDDTELVAGDISFTEAGGTASIPATQIKVVGNTIEISYDKASATPGAEYVLNAGALSSVLKVNEVPKSSENISVVLRELERSTVIMENESYDDITLDDYITVSDADYKTSWKSTTGPDADFRKSMLYPMIYDSNQTENWGTSTVMYVFPVDCTNEFPDHGKALNPYAQVDYVVAHNRDQENEYGVEIYEFEMASKNSSATYFGVLNGTRTSNAELADFNIKVPTDGLWHKVRLEYDTVNDTAQLFIDNEPSNVIKAVTSYWGLSWWISAPRYDQKGDPNITESGDGNSLNWILMDNYKFSISSAPLILEGLKATTAAGETIQSGTTDSENGDSVKITADVINPDGKTQSVTVIYALYKGTTLVDAVYNTVTIKDNLETTLVTKKGIEFDKYKAFIWDGITSAVPLIKSTGN